MICFILSFFVAVCLYDILLQTVLKVFSLNLSLTFELQKLLPMTMTCKLNSLSNIHDERRSF